MKANLAQAHLLLQQKRYKEAESFLRSVLFENPNDPEAHALLAFALFEQERKDDALREAQAAVRCAPDDPIGHHAGAIVLMVMGKYDEALSAIRTAIRLSPLVPDYYAVMGNIYLFQRRWQEALDAAETGLRFDAEDIPCNNIRAMALVKLGRKDEAGQNLEAVLALNPENALTHANQGWALLHGGQHAQALEHFREALRLNPQLTWAREGVVEALKARNPIYWVMLRYFLWMSRLSGGARWGFILGLYFLNRLVSGMRQLAPSCMTPLFSLFTILYTLFVFLSWTARPLFNLLLRLNRMGRLALSDEEITASNWVAVCLVAAIACLGGALIMGQPLFMTTALYMLMLVLPVASLFQVPAGKRRWFLITYAIGLALLAVGSLLLSLNGASLGAQLGEVFFWGWILYSWIANAVAAMR